MEAVQMLINALELFELGYLDCAYYSLRAAIETSTTLVLLSDVPERHEQLSAWRESRWFPTQAKVMKLIAEKGAIFADMRVKMAPFFQAYEHLYTDLSKYVHKQGLRHFYVSRNHPMNAKKSQKRLAIDFESHLTSCISVVAVMRLAIDPFPVLLMDEEMLYRCFDTVTEPYSQGFVDKYIGPDTLAYYRKTELYASMHEVLMREEKKPESVFQVTHNQYIDTQRIDELLAHRRLMSLMDVMAVSLVNACSSIVRVYCCGGLHFYFTDRDSNRGFTGVHVMELARAAKSSERLNRPYAGGFISAFESDGETYFVEHDEPLGSADIDRIRTIGLSVT